MSALQKRMFEEGCVRREMRSMCEICRCELSRRYPVIVIMCSFMLTLSISSVHSQTVNGITAGAVPDTIPAKALHERRQTPPEIMPSKHTAEEDKSVEAPVRHRVLLIGDSMCEGLGARFSDYAASSNFDFHTVIWYGSTSKSWATTRDLKYHIERVNPTYIIMSLGTNDLGYYDFARRRAWIEEIISTFGNIPYLWIGPLPWRKVRDRSMVGVIRDCTGENNFYDSSNVYCQRLDGVHPTFPAAAKWVDGIVSWINRNGRQPEGLSFVTPSKKTVFRPDEKHTPRYKGRM